VFGALTRLHAGGSAATANETASAAMNRPNRSHPAIGAVALGRRRGAAFAPLPIVVPLLAALAVSFAVAAEPPACRRVSAPNTVALLELYSSEGCNSCPPADRFVSEVVARGPGAERVVPIVLHVDYWDYIGWKDRFASPAYTARQSWLAAKNGAPRSVYTPELFLAGREWRGWRGADLAAALAAVNARPAAARIELTVTATDSIKIAASVTALPNGTQGAASDALEWFVALVEDDLTSAVSAGENSGVTLRHDAVVRQWAGPFTAPASVSFAKPAARGSGAAAAGTSSGKLRVVAFAQNRQTGEAVQALAVPLPCAS